MKKDKNNFDKKKTAITCGLSALCIAVLAGAYFLTREPETDFTPASTERADVTDTWEENSNVDTPLPSNTTPETTDDTTNPDKQPEYGPSVPQPSETPTGNIPTGGGSTDDSHPGQVYDPVFGRVDVGDTKQDNIDSDGDINKQIGTMGGN